MLTLYLAGLVGTLIPGISFYLFPMDLKGKREAASVVLLSFVWPVLILGIGYDVIDLLRQDL